MRIIILIVSLVLFSLLVVVILNRYVNNREYTMSAAQDLINNDNSQPADNPVEFSRDKVEDINSKINERSGELNRLQ